MRGVIEEMSNNIANYIAAVSMCIAVGVAAWFHVTAILVPVGITALIGVIGFMVREWDFD